MTLEKALLLDMNAGESQSKSSTNLRGILEPYFSVQVLTRPPFLLDSDLMKPLGGLDREIGRVHTSIIFLVTNKALLREARELLRSVKKSMSSAPIIIVSDQCEPTELFEFLKLGAADYVAATLSPFEVLPRVWRLVGQGDGEHPARAASSTSGGKQLIGENPGFLAQLGKIPLIAKCDANVLIAGETGTGKELFARAIHYQSPRAGRPFIPVNCGAIPGELVENELFGHERGAFTSASTTQIGLVDEANGGTLFLDEIDCLPPFAQVKLLRFLQDKEYRPLGSAKIHHANVRVITATNLDLEEAVDNGKLRLDLFYRLEIISLTLPPLRDRREDIPLLARHFLEKYASEFEKEVTGFSPEAMHLLTVQSWPGNVRQLEHVIERSVVLSQGPIILPSDLILSYSQSSCCPESFQKAKAKEIARFEKNYVQGLLSACKGNITKAAGVAQKNRRAFWQLIQKHQIDVSRFKGVVSDELSHS